MRDKVKFGALAALAYMAIIALMYLPELTNPGRYFIGIPSNDLYNEIILNYDVARQLSQGQLPLFSQTFDYPHYYSLLGGFKSYLHTALAWPFMALLPWPYWWNALTLFTLLVNALMVAWALYLVSSHRWGSAIGGGLFLLSTWNSFSLLEGHLVQIWYGPLLGAFALLYLYIWPKQPKPEPRSALPLGRELWLLMALVLISAFIYWLNAMFVAFFGLALLAFKHEQFSRSKLRQLILIVLALCCLAAPYAKATLLYSEDILDASLHNNDEEGTLGRAFFNSLSFPTGEKRLVLPLPASLPTWICLALWATLPFWSKLRSQRSAFWLWVFLLFFILGLGPHLAWYRTVAVNSNGEPLHLPMYYLMNSCDFLGRWQQPNVVWPLVFFALYASLLELAPLLKDNWRQSWWVGIAYLLALLLSLPLSLTDKERYQEWIQRVGPSLHGGEYTLIPQYPNPTFPHLGRLKQLPPGAIIDLPLYHAVNTWQYAFRHGHCHMFNQTAYGNSAPNPKFPNSLRDNDLLIWLASLNWSACAPQRPQPPQDIMSVGLPYGETAVPLPQLKVDQNMDGFLTRIALKEGQLSRTDCLRGSQELRNSGFAYLLLHRSNCSWLCPGQGKRVYAYMHQALDELCGSPLFEDEEAAIYSLPQP